MAKLKINSNLYITDNKTLNDALTDTTYSAGTGISLSGTTFSNSGVRSISSGSTNGTISVNTGGTSAEVAVKGLGTAAYTASTAYAAASHTHSYVPLSGTSSMTGWFQGTASSIGLKLGASDSVYCQLNGGTGNAAVTGHYWSGYGRVADTAHGDVSITPSAANTNTSKVVKFSKAFSGTPTVVVSLNTTAHLQDTGVSAMGDTTSQFTLWICSGGTAAKGVHWIANY